MPRRKNYFFVGTGLQVINSVEYIHELNLLLDRNIVVVCNTKINVRKEVISALSLYEWDKIIYLSPNFTLLIKPNYLNFIVNNLISCFRINLLDFKHSRLIGNDINYFFRYSVKVAERCNEINIILIDDGSGTINCDLSNPYYELKDKKNKILYKILGISNYTINPNAFFTIFEKELKERFNFKIIENKFTFLKKVCRNNEKNNKIYFIGDPHVERGYLTEEQYLQTLFQIQKKFAEEVIYVPRISEDLLKINAISKIISVQKNNIPFEVFLITDKVTPKALIGYHSSVLFNVYKLYGNLIDYYYIKLPNFTNEIHYNNIQKMWKKLGNFAKEIKFNDNV